MRDAILFAAQVISAMAAVASFVLAWLERTGRRTGPDTSGGTAPRGRPQARSARWFLAGVLATVLFIVLLVAYRQPGCGDTMPAYSSDRATIAKRWCISEDQLVQPAPQGWQFTGTAPVWAGMCLDVYATTDEEFRSHLKRGATTGPISHPVPGRSRGQLLSNGKAGGLATLYWVGCPPSS
jgi:ABC-type Fe3+ transport system permease subunit